MPAKAQAEVNGTQLYYEITGEGEPLVLLHSGYTDLRIWDDQFHFFGQHFKVIRYDIRGFGRSSRPDGSFAHFEDLKGLLDHLQIEAAHLIGVSMGGSIATDFTLQYPGRVKSLVLSGASLNGFAGTIDEASKQRSAAGMSIVKRDHNFAQSVEFMLNDPMWRLDDPRQRERLKGMFEGNSLAWALANWVRAAEPPAAGRLSEIRQRTLLITGSEDSLPIRQIAAALQAGIPGSQAITLTGTGHLPNMDRPAEFNRIVLEFLTGVAKGEF